MSKDEHFSDDPKNCFYDTNDQLKNIETMHKIVEELRRPFLEAEKQKRREAKQKRRDYRAKLRDEIAKKQLKENLRIEVLKKQYGDRFDPSIHDPKMKT